MMDQYYYSHPVPDYFALQREREATFNALTLSRQSSMSGQLDPRRDVYLECGYPSLDTQVGPDLYRMLFDREAVPNRAVELMPKECFQQSPLVFETDDPDEVTDFEVAWDDLGRQLRGERSWYQDEQGSPVWHYLRLADILSGIGHFGVILLGLDDGKNLGEPADGVVDTDSPMTKNEQDAMEHPKPREYVVPWKPTRDGRFETYKWSPPSLKPHERVLVNRWAKERQVHEDVVRNKVTTTSGGTLPGTDSQYRDNGFMAPSASALGTDQQYFGVIAGPHEMPSIKPPPKQRRLLFMRAFDESLVQIVRYEWNIRSPRFGLPVMYRITLNDPREYHGGVGLPTATVFVHWSRVVHLARTTDNAAPSEMFAPPVMRPILNNVLGLSKLYCSAPEMFYKGAFPGVALSTHPQLGGDVNVNRSQLRDMWEDYQNGLQRALFLMGMGATSLAPTVVDPTPQINAQIEAICIKLGCPVRVFKGSERGELASSQDDASWNDRLRERQNNYLTPRVIVPFIDRLIMLGVLPEPKGVEKGKGDVKGRPPKRAVANRFRQPGRLVVNEDGDVEEIDETTDSAKDGKENEGGGYSIEWPDLDSLSDVDKATIANTKTTALAAYVSGGCEAVVPPKEWFTVFTGFMDEEEVESMLKNAADAHDTGDVMTMPPQVEGQPKAAPDGSAAKQQQDQQAEQAKAQAEAVAKRGAAMGGDAKPNGKPAPPPTGAKP